MDAKVVRQLMRYGVVGALGTAVSTLLYLVFRIWWDAVPANLAALVLSAVLSTEANRRFTFGGAAADRTREYLQNAGTGRVLRRLQLRRPAPARAGRRRSDETLQESLAVAGASVVGGLARFVLLRNWVFGGRDEHVSQASGTVAVTCRPIVSRHAHRGTRHSTRAPPGRGGPGRARAALDWFLDTGRGPRLEPTPAGESTHRLSTGSIPWPQHHHLTRRERLTLRVEGCDTGMRLILVVTR